MRVRVLDVQTNASGTRASEKVAKLKMAKEEAEAEIAAYKQQREAQFQIFSKEVRG